MELLIFVAALVLLDVAALLWGADSRDDRHPGAGGILPQAGCDGHMVVEGQ